MGRDELNGRKMGLSVFSLPWHTPEVVAEKREELARNLLMVLLEHNAAAIFNAIHADADGYLLQELAEASLTAALVVYPTPVSELPE